MTVTSQDPPLHGPLMGKEQWVQMTMTTLYVRVFLSCHSPLIYMEGFKKLILSRILQYGSGTECIGFERSIRALWMKVTGVKMCTGISHYWPYFKHVNRYWCDCFKTNTEVSWGCIECIEVSWGYYLHEVKWAVWLFYCHRGLGQNMENFTFIIPTPFVRLSVRFHFHANPGLKASCSADGGGR